jgi:hypothetical protein
MNKFGKNLIGIIGTGLLTGTLAAVAFAADEEIIKIASGVAAGITGLMNLGCFVCAYKTSMNYYDSEQREKAKYKTNIDKEMDRKYPSSPN